MNSQPEPSIDVVDVLWRKKWFVAVVSVAVAVVVAAAAYFVPKSYRATVVLSPSVDRSDVGVGSLASLASQFGGIASLAGISIGGDSRRSEAIALLQSHVIVRQYIERARILPVLYADEWDTVTRTWRVDHADERPTLWQATERFTKKILTIDENPKSGLVTLTVEWKDPEVAAQWANDLVRATNDYMRLEAINRAEKNIEYLNEQVTRTDFAQLREAIFSILESEIKNVMLAKGTDEFALKIIDPAVPPELPSSPRIVVWTIVAFICGFAVSVLLVLAEASKASSGEGKD